jgi:hypothetical protein
MEVVGAKVKAAADGIFHSTNVTALYLYLLNQQTNSVAVETAEAGEYLVTLQETGSLPGVSKNSRGVMTTGDLPMSELKGPVYPFSRTFDVVVDGDTFTNHYTVARSARDTAWRLQKAWRTDSEGRTMAEWPVK